MIDVAVIDDPAAAEATLDPVRAGAAELSSAGSARTPSMALETPASSRRKELPRFLPCDAKPEVSGAGGLDDLGSFQLDLVDAVMLEQPDTVTQQHGHQVDPHLVDESGFHELLSGIRPAHHKDIPVIRGGSRLIGGAFDAFRDEGERR